jgi:GrpB-like predicted nucleotidyltransferase (UPF0157 family)
VSAALGLRHGHVTVLPYDARWPTLFADAATELKRELAGRILSIEHVGSTAIPGLCAKPILDILVGVPDFESARQLIPALTSLRYEFRPDEEIPDRHYFRRRNSEVRTHHLSLAEPGSSHYQQTIVFRDALRSNPAVARAYADLKLELAKRFPLDRSAYLEGKTEFVHSVLRSHGIAVSAGI